MHVKFQAILERIEFRGVSLKTILSFSLTLQEQIIPGQMDIFSGLFPKGHLDSLPIFEEYFTSIPLYGYFLE